MVADFEVENGLPEKRTSPLTTRRDCMRSLRCQSGKLGGEKQMTIEDLTDYTGLEQQRARKIGTYDELFWKHHTQFLKAFNECASPDEIIVEKITFEDCDSGYYDVDIRITGEPLFEFIIGIQPSGPDTRGIHHYPYTSPYGRIEYLNLSLVKRKGRLFHRCFLALVSPDLPEPIHYDIFFPILRTEVWKEDGTKEYE